MIVELNKEAQMSEISSQASFCWMLVKRNGSGKYK